MSIQAEGVKARPEASDLEAQYTEVAAVYDYLMRSVPYGQWMDYIRTLLRERRSEPATALDLACGTGNVTELLAADGMSTVGVDIAPAMIDQARRKASASGLAIRYEVQDAAELDLPGEKFDLCVSLFDSLNYIVESCRLEAAMRRIYRLLAGGGLFIFDLNSAFALRNNFFDQQNVGSGDRLEYRWVSEYSAASRICRVRLHFLLRAPGQPDHEFSETHWQYAYEEAEVLEMLKRSGFQEIRTYKAYTLRSPTRTTDRIFYVAERP